MTKNEIQSIVDEINTFELLLDFQDKELLELDKEFMNLGSKLKDDLPQEKRRAGRPLGSKDTKKRVFKTDQQAPCENNQLVKRGRGRPRLPSNERKPRPKYVATHDRCGRPCKENKVIQDAKYHRNYYQQVVSKNVVECEYCGRVVIKAKLSVHHNTKHCLYLQSKC